MASKKGKAAKSRARGGRRRGRSFGGASVAGVSWFFIGAIITFGGVILAKLCKLPVWLSPVGAALWLYGWWKNNAYIRSLGLLYIGTGIAALMGLPNAAGEAIDKLKAQGGLGGLFSFTGDTGGGFNTNTGGGGGGKKSFDLGDTIEVAADLTKALAPLFA